MSQHRREHCPSTAISVAQYLSAAYQPILGEPGSPLSGHLSPEWQPRRERALLWQIPSTFHCSIIGTCFSTPELRKLPCKMKVVGVKTDTDHDLHTKAVFFTERPEEGKLLHNALNRQHRATVAEFNKASGPGALRVLWRNAVSSGQIPGAYWSILTHPDTDQDLATDVFGEVHMLSHLKGAANRAELTRVHLLEGENARLIEKLIRQQQHLTEAFRVRDEAIRKLNEMTAAEESGTRHGAGFLSDERNATLPILKRRLAKEVGRRQQLEVQLEARSRLGQEFEAKARRLESQVISLRRELDTAEAQLDALLDTTPGTLRPIELAGRKVLYVGARPHQTQQFRNVTERLGGTLLYHDGGIENSTNLLPNLLSRADVAFFPVDCVSHDAAAIVNRLCSQSQKLFIPLRTSSLACFLSGLAQFVRGE